MPNQDSWQLALSEYIRQGEPDRAEKSAAWQTAIGLQAVDGLKTSPYLLETAKAHIEGDIDIAGAQRRIQSYYKEQANRKAVEAGTMEADIVSALAYHRTLGGENFSVFTCRTAEHSPPFVYWCL